MFYPKDALVDTAHLSSDAFTAYFRLNWYAWVGVEGCRQGTLPKDDKVLLDLAGIGGKAWGKVRRQVLGLFIEKKTCYEHKRLAAEKRAQRHRKVRAERAAKVRWEKEKDATSIPCSMPVASVEHGPSNALHLHLHKDLDQKRIRRVGGNVDNPENGRRPPTLNPWADDADDRGLLVVSIVERAWTDRDQRREIIRELGRLPRGSRRTVVYQAAHDLAHPSRSPPNEDSMRRILISAMKGQ